VIIGVISDTHGNRTLMHAVADRIRATERADFIIHLGDNYSDAEELADAGHAVRMVPGLQCDAYHDHLVPIVIDEAFDGCAWRVPMRSTIFVGATRMPRS